MGVAAWLTPWVARFVTVSKLSSETNPCALGAGSWQVACVPLGTTACGAHCSSNRSNGDDSKKGGSDGSGNNNDKGSPRSNNRASKDSRSGKAGDKSAYDLAPHGIPKSQYMEMLEAKAKEEEEANKRRKEQEGELIEMYEDDGKSNIIEIDGKNDELASLKAKAAAAGAPKASGLKPPAKTSARLVRGQAAQAEPLPACTAERRAVMRACNKRSGAAAGWCDALARWPRRR